MMLHITVTTDIKYDCHKKFTKGLVPLGKLNGSLTYIIIE